MARSTAEVTHILGAPRVLLSVILIRSICPLQRTLRAQCLQSSLPPWLQPPLEKYKHREWSLKDDNHHLLALSWLAPQKESAQTIRLTLEARLDNRSRTSSFQESHSSLSLSMNQKTHHFREEETEAQEVTDTHAASRWRSWLSIKPKSSFHPQPLPRNNSPKLCGLAPVFPPWEVAGGGVVPEFQEMQTSISEIQMGQERAPVTRCLPSWLDAGSGKS